MTNIQTTHVFRCDLSRGPCEATLPIPLMLCIGYLMGPSLRIKKLREIALGKKRKMRNLKVNKKPRKPKAEV